MEVRADVSVLTVTVYLFLLLICFDCLCFTLVSIGFLCIPVLLVKGTQILLPWYQCMNEKLGSSLLRMLINRLMLALHSSTAPQSLHIIRKKQVVDKS